MTGKSFERATSPTYRRWGYRRSCDCGEVEVSSYGDNTERFFIVIDIDKYNGGIGIGKSISYLYIIIIIVMVGFSGCTDKSAEDNSAKTTGGEESTVTSTKVSELPSKYIMINRSAGLYSSIDRYTNPAPGKVFLLLKMEIENHGYPEFSINPNYFSIIIDGVVYPYDSATYAIDEHGLAPLDSVKLRDGGETSGCLVFQIPENKAKSQYSIEYSGLGSYNFKYGSLQTEEQTVSEPEPEPIIRDVSFKFENDLIKISEDNLIGSIGYNSYSTTVSTSETGTEVNQVTKVDREDSGFLVVAIKTYLTEERRPTDTNKAIEDALTGAEKYVPVYSNRINKGGTYEETLSGGDKVDVHIWKAPSGELYSDEANVCCFMPDGSTIVTVVASLPNQMTTRFFETLEIGDIPQS